MVFCCINWDMPLLGFIEKEKRKTLTMGFYDYKGYWRNDGDGFYDAKGNWVNPGSGFYDSKGYFRSPRDGFYDAKGNWVNPGSGFYDSKGYFRSTNTNSATVTETNEEGIGIGGFIIFVVVGILWMLISSIVEWITGHLYVVFVGFAVVNAILTFVATVSKNHKGLKFALCYLGNYVCVFSFIYIILVYAIPSVIIDNESIGSILGFILMVALGAGSVSFVQFLNYYHGKAILEFIIGVTFFIVVMVFLKNNSVCTMENLAKIYNVELSVLFRILFSVAVRG